MRCNNCRKAEALDTKWDRIKRWLFVKLFPQQIIDFSQEKYTQGFGDGYTIGMKHGKTQFKPDMNKMWPEHFENAPIRVNQITIQKHV